jgi:TatD DNase family protein
MEKTLNSISNYIDSHCHLQDYSEEELEKILNKCNKKNLNILYTNATSNEDFDKNINIYKKYSNNNMKIIPGIGYHPWYLDNPTNNENWFNDFKNYIEQNLISNKIKFFIGEIGIDGGKIKKKFPLNFQIDIFTKQLLYANDNNLLVHIHCVYEWDKLYKVLSNIKIENLVKNNKILLHSFQGKVKHIEKFNKLNCYFSISSGCFIEKNFEMLKNLPNDKILFESDSPSMFNKLVYNSEDDYKDFYNEEKKLNSPESIIFLCKKLAELKGINEEEFRKIIYENSLKILEEYN